MSKDDFEKFERAISDKITMFSASDHYGPMLESLVPKVCLDLNASTIKSIKMNLEALYNTKLKDEKAAAQKAKKKGKGSSIKMDTQKARLFRNKKKGFKNDGSVLFFRTFSPVVVVAVELITMTWMTLCDMT